MQYHSNSLSKSYQTPTNNQEEKARCLLYFTRFGNKIKEIYNFTTEESNGVNQDSHIYKRRSFDFSKNKERVRNNQSQQIRKKYKLIFGQSPKKQNKNVSPEKQQGKDSEKEEKQRSSIFNLRQWTQKFEKLKEKSRQKLEKKICLMKQNQQMNKKRAQKQRRHLSVKLNQTKYRFAIKNKLIIEGQAAKPKEVPIIHHTSFLFKRSRSQPKQHNQTKALTFLLTQVLQKPIILNQYQNQYNQHSNTNKILTGLQGQKFKSSQNQKYFSNLSSKKRQLMNIKYKSRYQPKQQVVGNRRSQEFDDMRVRRQENICPWIRLQTRNDFNQMDD